MQGVALGEAVVAAGVAGEQVVLQAGAEVVAEEGLVVVGSAVVAEEGLAVVAEEGLVVVGAEVVAEVAAEAGGADFNGTIETIILFLKAAVYSEMRTCAKWTAVNAALTVFIMARRPFRSHGMQSQ